MKFVLGSASSGMSVSVDIPTLLRSRLLAQANSGGGKSWLIRRILEQSFGKCQQIVLDVEGEFSTLREQFDYIHIGKGGDIPADVRSAGLLAERLLEIHASAIVDLYELKHYDRIRYVKLFLDAMVNVRKELWNPCIVVIDEAHIFAPEKGESEALSSVIDLCTRGRKRSFCAILATQRLSKLHKDAAAECNNKLIGRTGLDIDVKRAAEELGFGSKDDQRKLRQLQPGEFFAFGPAISQEVVSVTVGAVKTTHPDVGSNQKSASSPAAPEKIRKMLEQLKDLPKEAEEKQRTIESMKKEITELKRELAAKPKAEVIQPDINKITQQVRNEQIGKFSRIESATQKNKKMIERAINQLQDVTKNLSAIEYDSISELLNPPPNITKHNAPIISKRIKETMPAAEKSEIKINAGARRLLNALLSWYPGGMTEGQWRSHAGLKKSGTYGTYKSRLRTAGLIDEGGGLVYATELAVQEYGSTAEPAPRSTEDVLSIWYPKLGLGARRMLEVLIELQGEKITNEALAERSGMSTSGTFGTYKSKLKTARLIDSDGKYVWANKETLFL